MSLALRVSLSGLTLLAAACELIVDFPRTEVDAGTAVDAGGPDDLDALLPPARDATADSSAGSDAAAVDAAAPVERDTSVEAAAPDAARAGDDAAATDTALADDAASAPDDAGGRDAAHATDAASESDAAQATDAAPTPDASSVVDAAVDAGSPPGCADGGCAECTSAVECATAPGRPYCDLSHHCVSCAALAASACIEQSRDAPFCNVASGACVRCLASTDCSATLTPSVTPICLDSVCVPCNAPGVANSAAICSPGLGGPSCVLSGPEAGRCGATP